MVGRAGPLDGIKVVDLSTVVAGPYATQMLGDMGADVLKVEPVGGDILRAAGPGRSPGMGAMFLNCNRNKRGLVLDLKQPDGRAALLDLVREADVFIHNMRTAAAARLQLGYETLQALNPRLVYCAIVGYGQDGPYRDRPAYDDVIQAAAGWPALEDEINGEPRYAPTIVADKTAALHAVGAINAALVHRFRHGAGQYVEVPMFEAMASFLLIEHLAGRSFVPPVGPTGHRRLMSRHRRPYRTRDGYLAVLPYNEAHWTRFFRAAGREDWAADPRLACDEERNRVVDELYERVSVCLPERDTAEWMALLAGADIPCSPVRSLEGLLDDEHLRAVGFFVPVEHPTEGQTLTTRPPVRFSATPCSVRSGAPALTPPQSREILT